MRKLGRAVRVVAQLSNGRDEVLLDEPQFNSERPPEATFDPLRSLPQGTQIVVEAHFGNPDGASQSMAVVSGPESQDETLECELVYFSYAAEKVRHAQEVDIVSRERWEELTPREPPQDFPSVAQIVPTDVATYFFRRARFKDLVGDYQGAIQDYSSAIDTNPLDVEALLRRGSAWMKVGSLPRALSDFNSVIQAQPQSARAFTLRGQCQTDAKLADADFARAIELDPAAPDPQLHRALLWKLLGKKEDSLALLQRINAVVHPAHFASRLQYAETLFEVGQIDKGLAEFAFAATRWPARNSEVLLRRALAWAALNRRHEAIQDLENALKQLVREMGNERTPFESPNATWQLPPVWVTAYTPDEKRAAEAAMMLGLALNQQSQALTSRDARKQMQKQAIRSLRTSLEYDATKKRVLVTLGELSNQVGDPVSAVQCYRRLMTLDPAEAWYPAQLAWILSTEPTPEVRDPSAALPLARQACEATQYKAWLMLDVLAAALAANGEFDQAIAMSARAIQHAEVEGQKVEASTIRARQKLYEQRRAYVSERAPD